MKHLAVLVLAMLATGLAATPPALAADPTGIGAPQDTEAEQFSTRIDLSWGVALTSNYMSNGITQSDDRPAAQGYVELSSGIVYTSLWMSSVRLGDDIDGYDNVEFDLAWGIRPELGPLAFDIGYYRYLYDRTGNCCGEWIATADWKLTDGLTLKGGVKYDPASHGRLAKAGFELGFAEKFSVSAEYQENLVDHVNDWNAGLGYQLSDTLSLDLRYHDSEVSDPRYVATLAWDFSTAE
ncbi:MAG: TorF family putative porin [Nitratireductor sp.]|nr:TorF family putative porin [Nitratireductor sp.]